ncbi:uncharacterized protein BCR38DRAFT_459129 [Pseudomassariella vexata]|uniref:Impact N-terminal domain-containing protein n=1 Tax=Pseudomassariella vexata TaxID=1141098 RepID=A0A1Y2DU53_9PEZI|nr:uncharacterized protein BCR38DRAFT_459129 [Pseudomassariella vexata]ORY62684.1 hypothetical protein BCR38DRAFT_459129 [Pseudomassariella vexata]
MASQQDLQELLRLLTLGKLPIKDAMQRVRALQEQNLRSIQQIAEAPLSAIESAIKDPKAAKSLSNACKARLKNPNRSSGSKRAGVELLQAAKRSKISADDTGYLDGPAPIPSAGFEASLALPVETDEETIAGTVLVTNRAPLVLAFAVELLRYTMPEQPPSSRLSLAQAVVSANSRSKAVAIGLKTGASADEEGWGHGQPRVRIMGREVTVLKRSGYEWKGEETVGSADIKEENAATSAASSATVTADPSPANEKNIIANDTLRTWSASSPVTLMKSTFIVRATKITESSQRQPSLQALYNAIPSLQTASHNAWAYRVKKPDMFGSHTIKEESFDDGESGCGEFMLKIMREINAIDTLVVMTRWYGGIMLGPDRWRIMRNCLKEALAERLRVTGEQASLGGEAVWGLDLEAMKNKSAAAAAGSATRSYEAGVVGMPIHRPEAARAYLLKSFAQRVEISSGAKEAEGEKPTTPKKKTAKALNEEKEENLGRLLGAIRILYDSWADHLSLVELDRRAWSWYISTRPEVEDGPAGWGAKGNLKLASILALVRKSA